jgi:colicin import membrane protein
MSAPQQLQPQAEPGKWASIGLSALMHALLLGLLIYGIRWQSRPQEAVEVELFRALPAPAAERPAPVPEPRPEPRAEPKPEPRTEPRPPPKPDIAVKEEKKPPKPEPKPAPKEEPKPRLDETVQRRLMEEELRRDSRRIEQQRLDQEAAREAAALRDAQASSARAGALDKYRAQISSKIRRNLVVPQDLRGNPEGVFTVTQLPDGSVMDAKMKKSTGNAALDAAIERAILKSSPLPKPDQPELFSRVLELKFRPLDE